MTEEPKILSMEQIGAMTDALEIAQNAMLLAIKEWNEIKNTMIEAGLELEMVEDSTLRGWVFPIGEVNYKPSIKVKL